MSNTPDYVAQLGRVTPRTRALALEVLAAAARAGHVLGQVWGYNPASKPEHSSGRAIDFMCGRAAGDWIADYLWTHRHRLGLKWMIWRQRIRSTTPGKATSWQPMADRGNTTQNHMDHVHAFFDDTYTPAALAEAPAPTPAAPTPGTATTKGGLSMSDIDTLVTEVRALGAKMGADESASDAYAEKNALALANISYGDITIGQAVAEVGRWAREQNRAAK